MVSTTSSSLQYYSVFKKKVIINAAKSPFTTLYLQDSHYIRETG